MASWSSWLPLLFFPAIAICFRDRVPAWLFTWVLSFAIFAALKWATWWRARNQLTPGVGRSIAYLAAWPGMDAEAFLDSGDRVRRPSVRQWLWASAKTALGVVLLWVTARRIPVNHALLRGWMGLVGLIFLLHFGSFHLLSLFWQAQGIDARPIMSNPIVARTLSEFWGKRWNLGFRQLAHEFIFRPLLRRTGGIVAGLLVFLVSGLVHDLVISVPARRGYGLPTAYFLLQGLGVIFERSPWARKVGLQRKLPARVFTLWVTAAPVYWLFHPAFVQRVILPFMRTIHAL
jgi:Membrane bound O-acyl transferase family